MADLAHEAIDIFGENIPYIEGIMTYDLGEYSFVAGETGTVFGVIQPAKDAEVASLPAGQRADVQYTLHTRQELKIGADGAEGDGGTDTYIDFKGEKYKVRAFADWSNRSFYKYGLELTEIQR